MTQTNLKAAFQPKKMGKMKLMAILGKFTGRVGKETDKDAALAQQMQQANREYAAALHVIETGRQQLASLDRAVQMAQILLDRHADEEIARKREQILEQRATLEQTLQYHSGRLSELMNRIVALEEEITISQMAASEQLI